MARNAGERKARSDFRRREALRQALEKTNKNDGWLPWRGMYGLARDLAREGLLQTCGVAAMPPHVLYVITDAGRKALEGK